MLEEENGLDLLVKYNNILLFKNLLFVYFLIKILLYK